MDEQEILKTAIDIEEKGAQFYAMQAAKSDNQYARLFFERMVAEEEDHREILGKLLANYGDGGNSLIDLGDIPEVDIFPGDSENFGEKYLDALGAALEIEKKNRDFYQEASENTENQNLKKVFDWLVDFEQVHVQRLKEELEFIESTAGSSELG